MFSLRRLRWKLTLTYTLAAVVTLLVIELFAASLVVAFLNSDLLPSLIVQQTKDSVASQLEPALDQTPPNVEGLRRELDSLFSGSSPNVQGTGENPPAGGDPVNI
jgi:hypothetical protein